jgi:CRISPR-associated protein Csm5
MSNSIGLNYQLDIEVLTPLHIGSGDKLLQGFDFEVQGNRTYRLKEEVILNDYWPDDPHHQQLLLSKSLSTLLQPGDYRDRPHYFAYVLQGRPAMREIVACIKDAQGRPYLPGSSLKGALRTAIMRRALERSKRNLSRGDIGRARGYRAAQRADDDLDHEIFGPDPNNDLLRALQVGDCHPLSTGDLRLTRVRMVPGLDIDVESIARGARMSASLRVDTYALSHPSKRLRWPRENADLVQDFVSACQQAVLKRLDFEYQYHTARHQDAPAANFYVRLIQELTSGQWPPNEFLLQVGFAAGWRSKSVLGTAENDDPLLTQIIREFKLDRGGKRFGRSGGHKPGDPFPKARHLAYVRDKAALPMGWLRVRAVPLEDEKQRVAHITVREPDVPEPEPPEPAPPPPPELPAPTDELLQVPGPPEPTPPAIAPGPHTGTVTYFNLMEKQGAVRLDEGQVEIQVRLDQLRKGVNYLYKDQRVSLTIVRKGDEIHPQDVGPA